MEAKIAVGSWNMTTYSDDSDFWWGVHRLTEQISEIQRPVSGGIYFFGVSVDYHLIMEPWVKIHVQFSEYLTRNRLFLCAKTSDRGIKVLFFFWINFLFLFYLC